MLITIIGNVGKGKTLLLVALAVRTQERVIANFNIKLQNYEELSINKFIKAEYENASIYLDEAYAYIESRLSGSERNRVMSYILFQSRKKSVNLYLTAQLFSAIDIRFREMSDIIIIAEGQDKNNDFVYSAINKATNSLSKFKINHNALSQLYQLYNTLEVIKPQDMENSMLGMTQLEKAELADKIIAELKDQFPNKKITHNLIKAYLTINNYPEKIETLVYVKANIAE